MQAIALSESVMEAFFAYEWGQLSSIVYQYYTEKSLRQRLRNYIEQNCSYIDNTDFGIAYYNNYKIAQTKPADYQYQLFTLDNNERILLSIRFLGTDINKPFVEIVHRTFAINAGRMAQLAPLIAAHYQAFSPKDIRFLDGNGALSLVQASFRHDLHYVLGDMTHIRTLPYPMHYAALQLQQVSTASNCYNFYKQIYQSLVIDMPIYKELVAKEKEADLQVLADKGYLFVAYINGERAGLVAVDLCTEYCLQGFCVFEEILSQKYRGKGYGKALQRRLIEALSVQENRYIYGTIDDRNIPSLKTALGVGRQKIASYVFYAL